MAGKSKKSREETAPDGTPIRVIARNRRARFDFAIDETFEAGIALVGSEVKVLRSGKVTVSGAYVRIDSGEAWVAGLQIPEYPEASYNNHEVERPRKLLLSRRQIDKLARELTIRGAACVVLSVYFKGARVKLEIGLATGRKRHDKRHVVRARDNERELRRTGGH